MKLAAYLNAIRVVSVWKYAFKEGGEAFSEELLLGREDWFCGHSTAS